MKENVGKKDQLFRSFVGPGLLVLGLFLLKRQKSISGGVASLITGTLIAESAITRVCPVNELFGIDTRKKNRSPLQKIKEALA